MEHASGLPVGPEFYLLHKAVIRESAESTKLCRVYNVSAYESDKAPSLKSMSTNRTPNAKQAMGGFSKSVLYSSGCLDCALLMVWCHQNDSKICRGQAYSIVMYFCLLFQVFLDLCS